ncbi:DUF397 domain-containing protein [Streptomyces winkii]|uniref:DUF397 domain-containing protein n=1 Tax=Streptomyces winkii TaxID=3051178 RepID=UPI0028D28A1A|nr:DUF397 domain-containing protein [Streptomyces sp. DSM 40971]
MTRQAPTRHGVHNGMPARELGTEGWHKPWSGQNGGACVEAKRLSDGCVALRQSTDPESPALLYSMHGMTEFIEAAKSGDADFLTS